MKRTLYFLIATLSLGLFSFADDPEIALGFEGQENEETIQADGTLGIKFSGKDFLSRDAKSGEFSLRGNLIALDAPEGALAKEYASFTTAAWVKIGPMFKSGALFLRLVGGSEGAIDGTGRMKVLLRAAGPNHYCITFTVHAVGEKDEKTFTSDQVELPLSPEWVHIAAVFSQSEIFFYRDGELISRTGTTFESVPALQGAPVFYVGGGDATLDNWTFFERALESNELQELMNKD